MKLILHTHSTNSEYNGGCDYAVVDLSPGLVEQIRKRAELARPARQKDDGLYELYFWGSPAEFYGSSVLDVCQQTIEKAQGEEAAFQWGQDLDRNDYAVLPDGVGLSVLEEQRTEYDQTILRVAGSDRDPTIEIAWTASPKHSDIYVTTNGIRIDHLVRIAL